LDADELDLLRSSLELPFRKLEVLEPTYREGVTRLLSNVEVVALLAVLGESFCKDLVLELILDLLLFKLDTPFLSALNILRLFLGATTLLATPFPVLEFPFSWGCSSLLFFLRFFVKSLILVKVVPLES